MLARRLLVSTFALVLAGGVAFAQGQPRQPAPAAPAPAAPAPEAPRTSKTEGPEEVTLPDLPVVFVEGQAKGDQAGKAIDAAFTELFAALDKAKIEPNGAPMLQYFPASADTFRFRVLAPLAQPLARPPAGSKLKVGKAPAGKALLFRHLGTPDELDRTYEVLQDYVEANKVESAGTLEVYESDPNEQDPAKQVINVLVLVR